MAPAKKQGLWIFGGPFSGKSTLQRAYPGEVREFDSTYDALNEALPASERVDRRAWREEHPQHDAFMRLRKAVISKLRAHAQAGGLSLNHDPDPESGVPNIWLRPSPAELKERIAKHQADTHRVAASAHWEAKARERRYDASFPVVNNLALDVLVKSRID